MAAPIANSGDVASVAWFEDHEDAIVDDTEGPGVNLASPGDEGDPAFSELSLHALLQRKPGLSAVTSHLATHPSAASERDSRWRMPLHVALGARLPPKVVLAVLRACPHAAADADGRGDFPLHIAMATGADIEVVTMLLQAHPKATEVPTAPENGVHESFGKIVGTGHPLHIGLAYGAPTEVVLAVLEANIGVATQIQYDNAISKVGLAALHIALLYGATAETVAAIYGAYPAAAKIRTLQLSRSGFYTPLQCGLLSKEALEEGLVTFVHLDPLEAEGGFQALTDAFYCECWTVAAAIVDVCPQSARFQSNHTGYHALHVAMIVGAPEDTVRVLVECYPEATSVEDVNGLLPLHLGEGAKAPAASIEIVRKAYPNARRPGTLVQLLAAKADATEITAFLAAHPDAVTTPDGRTEDYPLHCGLWLGASAVTLIAVLTAFPEAAQLSCKRNHGCYPLHIALQKKIEGAAVLAILRAFPRAAALMEDHMFPLHLALLKDAPDAVILAILAAYPEAAREKNWANGLFLDQTCARPLYFAVTHARSLEVITAIVEAYPRAVCDLVKTNNGSMRRAVSIARENHAPEEMIAAVDPMAVMPQFLLTGNLENDSDLLTEVQQQLKSLEKSAAITAAREMMQAAFLHSCVHNFIKSVGTTIKSIVEPDACGNLHLHTVLFQRAPAKTVLEVLDANRNAAKEYTSDNRLALHIALENDAGATTIRALLEAFPAAASVGLPNNACGYGLAYSKTNDYWIELDRGIEKRCSRRRPYAVRDDLPDQLPFYWALQHRANADVLAALAEFHPVEPCVTAPLQAALMQRAPVAVIAALMSAFPESVCATDKDGLTPLHRAVGVALPGAVAAVVLKCPAAAGVRDPNGNTALHHATLNPSVHPSVVRILMCSEGEHFLPGTLAPLFVPDSDPEFTRLRKLLSTSEPVDAGCEDKLQAGELCKGWTALSLAAAVSDGWAALQWLLQQNAAGTIGPHGDPELLNRHAVAIAKMSRNKNIRAWGNGYGRLLQRYELPPGDPQHRSATCVVIFATDSFEDERQVALKFMSDESAFKREIKHRCTMGLTHGDPVIQVLRHHELLPADTRDFPQIRLPGGQNLSLKYLLVLERGVDGDLSDVISHGNVAGVDPDYTRSIALTIARCLKFMNTERGVLHGDVKARNFVGLGQGRGFAAIDLDASANITSAERVGQKDTSTGCAPPEFARVLAHRCGSHALQSAAAAEAEIVRLRQRRAAAVLEDNEAEVDALGTRIAEIKQQVTPPPLPPIATPQYDMWGFGVLLYELSTGRSLFHVDIRENADSPSELARIAAWTDSHKAERLRDVEPMWPRELLSNLLQRDPALRPTTWDDVIEALQQRSGVPDPQALSEVSPPRFQLAMVYSSRAASSEAILRSLLEEVEASRPAHDTGPIVPAIKDRIDHNCRTESDVWGLLTQLEAARRRNPSLLLHFMGHGEGGQLQFESKDGRWILPDPRVLATKIAKCRPACVVFSACQTDEVAQATHATLVASGRQTAVVCFWRTRVSTQVCEAFSDKFYAFLRAYPIGDVGESGSIPTELCLRAAADAWLYVQDRFKQDATRSDFATLPALPAPIVPPVIPARADASPLQTCRLCGAQSTSLDMNVGDRVGGYKGELRTAGEDGWLCARWREFFCGEMKPVDPATALVRGTFKCFLSHSFDCIAGPTRAYYFETWPTAASSATRVVVHAHYWERPADTEPGLPKHINIRKCWLVDQGDGGDREAENNDCRPPPKHCRTWKLSESEELWFEHKGACFTGGATCGDLSMRLNMERPGWDFANGEAAFPHRPAREHGGNFAAPEIDPADVAPVFIYAERVRQAESATKEREVCD